MPSINLETEILLFDFTKLKSARYRHPCLCEVTKNNYRIIKFTPVRKSNYSLFFASNFSLWLWYHQLLFPNEKHQPYITEYFFNNL